MQKLEARIRNLLVEKKANCSNKTIICLRFSDESINVLAAEIARIIDKVEPFAPILHKSELSINRRVFIDLVYNIFSDNTIVDSYEYSINLIKKMYHSEEHNITKSRKKMFYEIFGFSYNYHFKNTNVLINSFNRAYNDFNIQGERPVYVMEILKDAFKKRLPLSCFDNEPLTKFKSNRNYILYGLITEFGEDSFLDYLNDMINQYRERVYNLDSLITFHSIAAYIYGEDAVLAHSFHYRYVYDDYNHTLFSLTYKAIYPVTYYHSKSFAQRMIIYKFLELSESEIKVMEKNRHSVNWKKPSSRIYANINDVANSEKEDICSDGIMSRIKEKVDVLYSVAISKRTLPNRKDLFNHLRKTADNEMLKIITYLPNHALSYSKFLIYIEEKNNELKKILCNNNDQIKFSTNVWKYWERNRTKYECITLIFSDLGTTYYKDIQKKYMKYVINNNFGAELIRRAYSVKNFLIFLEHQFEVTPLIEEIRTDYILLFLHYIETKDKVTPKQLSRRVTALKRFFKWYYDANNLKHKILPTEKICLHNADGFTKHIAPIQNDVLGNLEYNVIHEADVQDKLIFRISIETAWRFSDIANLITGCLAVDKSDSSKILIWTMTQKTRTSRIKKGLGDRIESYISHELNEDILAFINDSRKIREDFKIKTLFYRFSDGIPVLYSNAQYISAIRRICNDKYIQEPDESIINFQSRKTRKTVAVDLINSNFSLTAVQQKLWHTKSSTTAKYYAEVQQMKLAELNHEFFTQRFNLLLNEETLSNYSESERKLLYVDFCMNYRSVELGKCSRHPSEGRCNYLENNNCSTCPKICTGKKYLAKWQELLDKSKGLVKEYIRIYQERNIAESEYSYYIEFKQEIKLMERYECVINAINSEDY